METGNHWETQEYKKGSHNGEDLINRTNITKATPCWLIAIECGRVSYTGYTSTRGYYVEIQHDNGKVSVYQSVSNVSVKENDNVLRGQVIANSGTSKLYPNDFNLHFELINQGVNINPEKYYNKSVDEF